MGDREAVDPSVAELPNRMPSTRWATHSFGEILRAGGLEQFVRLAAGVHLVK